jgi:putative transcriptional regulator
LTLLSMGRTSARGRRNGVRAARTALGLTQAELAAAVGVTRQTVVAVEAGDYAPSVYLALAIAERLGGSVEDLFGERSAADRPAPMHGGGAEL